MSRIFYCESPTRIDYFAELGVVLRIIFKLFLKCGVRNSKFLHTDIHCRCPLNLIVY